MLQQSWSSPERPLLQRVRSQRQQELASQLSLHQCRFRLLELLCEEPLEVEQPLKLPKPERWVDCELQRRPSAVD